MPYYYEYNAVFHTLQIFRFVFYNRNSEHKDLYELVLYLSLRPTDCLLEVLLPSTLKKKGKEYVY